MRRRLITAVLGLSLGLAGGGPAWAQRFAIDPEHVAVGFLVGHIGYAKVLGLFREVGGGFTFVESTRSLSDVRVVVKTASVYTAHQARDDHLKGADFLNVREFPEMVFVGRRAEPTGERTGRLHGDLTLLGVTRPIVLDVTFNKAGVYPFSANPLRAPNYVVGISARGSFKRSAFGMTYGVANGLVGDDVEMIVEMEGIRQ